MSIDRETIGIAALLAVAVVMVAWGFRGLIADLRFGAEVKRAAKGGGTMSDRLTFRQCLSECMNTPELIEQFDRLGKANLSLKGSPIELMIDNATGRIAGDFAAFVAFVLDCVYLRLPPDALVPIADDPDREFLRQAIGAIEAAKEESEAGR